MTKISQSELEIMEIIWDMGENVSIAAIIERLPKKRKYTTVATFVSRLKEKGLLRSVKQGAANVYSPVISRAEYKQRETTDFLNTIHHGSSKSLFAALFSDKLKDDDIDELMNWIETRENND